ncbi:MAG: pilus assembly protein [Sphingomonadales bacterium]|nr:pilus assembly protein [Sphingomonadales bacterium]MDE2170468.1 pilus assembly protein [Sphingomonadales bacterium]
MRLVWWSRTTVPRGTLCPARIIRDRHGVAAMEFALIAPLLLALILGILNTSLIFLAQSGLETSAEAAARIIMTGQAQNAGMTQGQFQTAACATLPPFLQCNRLYVDVTNVSSFSSASLGAPTFTYDKNGNVTNSFSFSPGTRGSIAVVRLMYLWPTTNGPFGLQLSNTSGNNRLLQATSVLKTEYY